MRQHERPSTCNYTDVSKGASLMARTEARIRCAVWRNREFTSLPLEAQGLYWMLLSQPDVSLAGVVPHNPTRWANLTSSEVTDALELLVDGEFIVVDHATGEVWIRTFPRHDGVLASPKTRAGMWSAWHNMLSPRIRGGFIDQLDDEHLNEAHEKGWVSEGEVEQALLEAREALSDGVSEGGQDGVSDGVSLARADSDTYTDTNSDTNPLSTDVDADDGEVEEQFEQFWSVWPKRNGKKIGKGDALSKWKRLTLPQRRAAYIGARNYAAACADPNVRGVGAQDAFRWLEKRRWEDWQEPAVPDDDRPPPASQQVSTFHGDGGRF